MTAIQIKALALMYDRNIGALPVSGFGWVFPTLVRNDRRTLTAEQADELAARVVAAIEAK